MQLLPFLKLIVNKEAHKVGGGFNINKKPDKLTISSILMHHNSFENPIRQIVGDFYFWQLLQILKELTSEINYGCGFDEKGRCKARDAQDRVWSSEMCCCVDCAGRVGYLTHLIPDKDILISIARLYNKKTGFWKKGIGCILERKYRSEVCLGHSCGAEFTKRNILIHKIGGYTVLQGIEAVANYWTWKHYRSDYNRLPDTEKEVIDLVNEMIEFLLEHGEEAGLIKFIGYKESYVSCELWMPKKLI